MRCRPRRGIWAPGQVILRWRLLCEPKTPRGPGEEGGSEVCINISSLSCKTATQSLPWRVVVRISGVVHTQPGIKVPAPTPPLYLMLSGWHLWCSKWDLNGRCVQALVSALTLTLHNCEPGFTLLLSALFKQFFPHVLGMAQGREEFEGYISPK